MAVALLGAFVGAGLWAVASHSHNHHYAARGRMAALTSGGGGAGHRRRARPGQLLRAHGIAGPMRHATALLAVGAVLAAAIVFVTHADPGSGPDHSQPGVHDRGTVQRAGRHGVQRPAGGR